VPPVGSVARPVPEELFVCVDPPLISLPPPPLTPVTLRSTTIFVPGVAIEAPVAPGWTATVATLPLPPISVPMPLVSIALTFPETVTFE